MAETDWRTATVSIVIPRPEVLPYSADAWSGVARAALAQDPPVRELIIVDGRENVPALENLPTVATRVVHLPGPYENRAAMVNAGILAASSDHVALVDCTSVAAYLKHSAIQTMLMCALRRSRAAMVYGDYEQVNEEGVSAPRHLSDYHAGRLRDTTDLGAVWLFDARTMHTIGLLNADYAHADLYDLRLRLSELCDIVRVANKYAGALYTVAAAPPAHDVFDYLQDDRTAQVEYERALTQHLKRIGAYVAPRGFTTEVTFSTEELAAFDHCVASVIIPVHRRPEFIGAAIESVLTQTVRACEVIVVINGGDDDPTDAEVRRYMAGGDRHRAGGPSVHLVVVDVNNLGYCLNVGLGVAHGKIYVQLDSDDRLKPDAVEKLLAVFDSNAAIGAVIGSYEMWDLDPETEEITRNASLPVVTHDEWTDENGANNLLRVNGAGAPRAAYVKVIQEVGWFGANDTPHCRNYGEDYDLVLRISERYRIGRVWEPIYEVVRHAGGTDHTIDRETIDRNDNAKDAMRLEAVRRRQRKRSQAGQASMLGDLQPADQDVVDRDTAPPDSIATS